MTHLPPTSRATSTLRIAAILFGAFIAANAFFVWSADAWFHLWGEPTGLVNPAIDKWVITPLAMLVWAPQLPSYGAFDYFEKLRRFGPIDSVLVVSLLSTAIYTPLVRWILNRRGAARAAVAGK